MKQLSNEQLLEFSQGNPRAFEAVFNCFRMRIFYFVKGLIGNRQEAEDITSRTFVKLYQLHNKFQTVNNIQAFLFITARNASLDFLKLQQRQRARLEEMEGSDSHEDTFPLFAESNIEADVLKFIYDEVEKLPGRSQMIFKLFYFQGRSIGEIAKIMKISQQTVANQKATALKTLRMKISGRPGLFVWLLWFLIKKMH